MMDRYKQKVASSLVWIQSMDRYERLSMLKTPEIHMSNN